MRAREAEPPSVIATDLCALIKRQERLKAPISRIAAAACRFGPGMMKGYTQTHIHEIKLHLRGLRWPHASA